MQDPSLVSVSPNVVTFISTFVREEFTRTGRPISGALLAERIRERFPTIVPEKGTPWLGGFVREAEKSELVIRNRNVKHLELRPAGVLPSPVIQGTADEVAATLGSTCEVERGAVARAQQFRQRASERIHVKSDVWDAFVYVPQSQSKFYDRNIGQVVSGIHSQDLIPITPISSLEQQSWMREFIKSLGTIASDSPPIDSRQWWTEFPRWLRAKAPDNEADWWRFRASQVISKIRDWARLHNLPEESIFERALPSQWRMDSARSLDPNAQKTRAAILAAIAEMSVNELSDISIPVRYILGHFIPR